MGKSIEYILKVDEEVPEYLKKTGRKETKSVDWCDSWSKGYFDWYHRHCYGRICFQKGRAASEIKGIWISVGR